MYQYPEIGIPPASILFEIDNHFNVKKHYTKNEKHVLFKAEPNQIWLTRMLI
ncbi:hypothetical protein LguiB_020948 [Lonicera macranthoides]